MDIWIIDHYSVPVKYYPLARNTNFARFLMRSGHSVTIFAASTVHNSALNLIHGKKKNIEIEDEGVKYVLINCHQYTGNGLKRILNMYEFAGKLESVCARYPRPDAIISTSMTLFACRKGIQLGQKYGCKKIAQITDLWPESLIAYGMATRKHPLVLYFRCVEKWIYKHSDRIIFSMEGAYDYIKEQGWDKEVPKSKVFYINNGVDLEQFDYNCEHYKIDDIDLDNNNIFKVIYTGSIRKVNNLGLLLDAAKLVKNDRIKFLVWGGGNELEQLRKRIETEQINNVKLKGKVDKKYIPFITTHADINFAHGKNTPLVKYGLSLNKMFDYLAAGKPILTEYSISHSEIGECGAVVEIKFPTAVNIARTIDEMSRMKKEDLKKLGKKAREGAKQYDFKNLTKELESIICDIGE